MTNRQSTIDPRPGSRAFTLLEAILALGLTVLLVGAVCAFYHHSLDVHEVLREQVDTLLARRRVLDMAAEDLRSAILYSTLQVGLNGSSEQFSLARSVVPSRAVYLTPTLIGSAELLAAEPAAEDTAFDPQHDVQLVSYRLDRYTDDEGVEQIGGLERLCERTILAETAEEGANVEVVLLSRHIKLFHVQYWDGQQWATSWERQGLPLAVRVDLGIKPLEEGQDFEEYPYETTWRVIAIPTALRPGGRDGGAGGPTR